jgi:hypothetical protein
MESRLLPSSQISGKKYDTVVSVKCMMWKVCRSPTLCRYKYTINYFKWQKQGSLSSFRSLTGWGLHRFVWNLSENSLKGGLSNNNIVNTPLFSLVNTFKLFDPDWYAGELPGPLLPGAPAVAAPAHWCALMPRSCAHLREPQVLRNHARYTNIFSVRRLVKKCPCFLWV